MGGDAFHEFWIRNLSPRQLERMKTPAAGVDRGPKPDLAPPGVELEVPMLHKMERHRR